MVKSIFWLVQARSGFSHRIAVQVKATSTPVDVTVLRNLQGVLKKFGADQGLLVSEEQKR
jgi:restriction system protein